jgi:hypothetical protein
MVRGARYYLTYAEYTDLGYPAWVGAPAGFLARSTSVVPSGASFLRDPVSGLIVQVIGGVKYGLTLPEWMALGPQPTIHVPAGFIAGIPTGVPSGQWFLRDIGTGAIFEVIGGTKRLLTYAEYVSRGAPPAINIPSAWIASIPNSA